MNRRSLLALFLAGAAGRSLRADEEKPASSAPAPWPPQGYTRIMACRFRTPERSGDGALFFSGKDGAEPSREAVEQHEKDNSSSMIWKGQVLREKLTKHLAKSIDLSADDQAALLKAAAIPDDVDRIGIGCYTPHHIFLFLDQGNAIRGALEICFTCLGSAYAPGRPAADTRPDLRALAVLCEKTVGLGQPGMTAASVSKELDKYERPKASKPE